MDGTGTATAPLSREDGLRALIEVMMRRAVDAARDAADATHAYQGVAYVVDPRARRMQRELADAVGAADRRKRRAMAAVSWAARCLAER